MAHGRQNPVVFALTDGEHSANTLGQHSQRKSSIKVLQSRGASASASPVVCGVGWGGGVGKSGGGGGGEEGGEGG